MISTMDGTVLLKSQKYFFGIGSSFCLKLLSSDLYNYDWILTIVNEMALYINTFFLALAPASGALVAGFVSVPLFDINKHVVDKYIVHTNFLFIYTF